ncbi:hypothetical protein, partial [Escherichia coli]|uniref:hypothetical protein n=1 Tax=Escherichia coli TaxID=562 RepID=UPI002578C929
PVGSVLRVRSSITKSEPTGKPAGPHDLAFDDFRNGERWQILIWRREVLAGCRGAALTPQSRLQVTGRTRRNDVG